MQWGRYDSASIAGGDICWPHMEKRAPFFSVLAPMPLLTLRWDFCTIRSAMVPASTHGDDVSSGCDFLLSPTLIISPSIAKLVTQAVNSTEVSRLLLLLFKNLRKQTKIDGQTKPKRCRICSLTSAKQFTTHPYLIIFLLRKHNPVRQGAQCGRKR